MKPISRWALLAAALVLTAAALTVHLVGASGVTARSGRLAVTRGAVGAPGPEVHGDVLVIPGAPARRLAAAASAPLVGSAAPVAAMSPDGSLLAYNTFRWRREIDWVQSLAEQGITTGDPLGTPQIHVRALARGGDTPLEPGSQSLTWRADGALAYVVGAPADYRANLPFTASVAVRPSADAAPSSWTSEPARYRVLGWAGRTLLVERAELGAAPDVLALEGPGRARTLAEESMFLAVSPDGTEALVATTLAQTPAPRIRLLRVADGSSLAELFLADARDPVTQEPTVWVTGPASWIDDKIAVASSTGLLVLRTGGGLSVEQVLHLDSATQPNGQLFEPRFTDDSAREIVAWSGIPGPRPTRAAQILCDRFALTCTRGPAVVPADVPRPVYDQSGGDR